MGPAPMLLRAEEKRLVAMVLASSSETGAPDEVYHRVSYNGGTATAPEYWCVLRRHVESWWNDVKSPVEHNGQVRSSGMYNHIGA